MALLRYNGEFSVTAVMLGDNEASLVPVRPVNDNKPKITSVAKFRIFFISSLLSF